MTRQVPDQVDAAAETADGSCIQNRIGIGIEELDLLTAAGGSPVQEVGGQRMGLTVGEVKIVGQTGGGIVAGSDAIGPHDLLQAPEVGGGVDPVKKGLPREPACDVG